MQIMVQIRKTNAYTVTQILFPNVFFFLGLSASKAPAEGAFTGNDYRPVLPIGQYFTIWGRLWRIFGNPHREVRYETDASYLGACAGLEISGDFRLRN